MTRARPHAAHVIQRTRTTYCPTTSLLAAWPAIEPPQCGQTSPDSRCIPYSAFISEMGRQASPSPAQSSPVLSLPSLYSSLSRDSSAARNLSVENAATLGYTLETYFLSAVNQ